MNQQNLHDLEAEAKNHFRAGRWADGMECLARLYGATTIYDDAEKTKFNAEFVTMRSILCSAGDVASWLRSDPIFPAPKEADRESAKPA